MRRRDEKRRGEGRGHIHEAYGGPPPELADLAGVGEVAQIAEHTGILDSASLACLVGLIAAVGADEGKDPLEDWGGQFEPGREDATPLSSVVVVLLGAGII